MADGSIWPRQAALKPRPHQHRALADVLAELKRADRATLVMACGTGKTLVGTLAAADTIAKGGIVVALSPSLALIGQTAPSWVRDWPNQGGFRHMAVCSDSTVIGYDEIEVTPADLPFDVTTDISQTLAFIRSRKRGQTIIIFATYQSAAVVGDALKAADKWADFTIFDEAHKTAGHEQSEFGLALYDERLPSRKRLFMTATPRITKRQRRNKDGDFPIMSMDDPAVYGQIAHRYTFRQGADDGIICRYRVIVSCVRRSELPAGVPEEEAAALVALSKAMAKFGCRKIISYHRLVEGAESFADKASAYLPDLSVGHINGHQPSSKRRLAMEEFALSDEALLTNARCLTEGIDVPAIDLVSFMSRRKSPIDIVQAIGRALRTAPGKEFGYVLVPLLLDLDAGETEEEAVQRQELEPLWEIISSLMDEDTDLSAEIKRRTRNNKEHGDSGGRSNSDLPIDLIDDPGLLRQAIDAHLVEQLSSRFDQGCAAFELFEEREGHGRVPTLHIEGEFPLGSWVAYCRHHQKNKRLSANRVAALETMPGWTWSELDDNFEHVLSLLAIFARREGHAHVPKEHMEGEFPLGPRIYYYRRSYVGKRLSANRIAALEAVPGWTWSERDDNFEHVLSLLAIFARREGHAHVPKEHMEGEFPLGSRIYYYRHRYKARRLPPDRIAALEAVPRWTWRVDRRSKAR